MKIKKIFIAMSLLLILVFSFGCQPKFDENKAKTDSKQSLQTFLSSHKNKEVLVNSIDGEKVKNYIDTNFKEYFTKDFINDTNNSIDDNSKYQNSFNYKNTFYLISSDNKLNTQFFNDFKLDSPEVDAKNETVKYLLKGNDFSTKGYVNITIKQEDGKWKIDKVD